MSEFACLVTIIPYFTGLAATVPPMSSESSTLDLSSNFLPESFPEGVDPSHYALPVFLEEPKDTYAARGAPAVLTCQVAHALKAHFVCNEEKRASLSEEDLQDTKTQMRQRELKTHAQVDLTPSLESPGPAPYDAACIPARTAAVPCPELPGSKYERIFGRAPLSGAVPMEPVRRQQESILL